MDVLVNQNDVSHDENCRINAREVPRCSEAVTAINFARSRERKYQVRSGMKLLPAGHLTAVRRVQFPNKIILRR